MKVAFTPQASDDLAFWIATRYIRALTKIHRLISDIIRDPDGQGLGKAERLKADLAGYSSRRISEKDRLVYRVEGGMLLIIQDRGHY